VTPTSFYEFGRFRLDMGGRLLFRDGERIAVTPKAVQVLIALVESRGKHLNREELLHAAWGDTAVEEGSLTSQISLLRKVLGEEFIETIPKRGYRFLEPARKIAEAQGQLPQIQSLAVLPLENLGPNPDDDHFADSMTEALITDLAKIGSLRVVSRTSIMRYKNTQKSLPEIGRELNVDAVVEGSVQHEGERVRIRASLVRAATDQHLWAEAYDRDLRDILFLQNDVARAIAQQVQAKLTPEEQVRLSTARPVQPEAYELCIKGRYFWVKRTEESIHRAIAFFQRAITLDPSYAAAHSGLADCYSSLGFSFDVGSERPGDVQPKARTAALKALELDDSLADAHNSLAYVMLNYDWDWPGAEVEFKRALELNPGNPHAHHWYAHLLLSAGRHREALAESNRALKLDQLSPIMTVHLGWHYLYSGLYDEAIDQLTNAVELDPNFGLTYWYRGLAYEQKGMYEDALRELNKAQTLLKSISIVEADIAHLHAVSGNKSEAERALTKLTKELASRHVNPYEIALIYVGLGEREKAIAWLDTAFRERSDMLVYLGIDRRLDSIRPDARFTDLVRRIGIPT
jgi:adenylate cyclase